MSRVIVVLHPSDELYGADRVLLAEVARLSEIDDVQVWLPTDVDYPEHALSQILRSHGIEVRFTELPVLRRAYANPRDVAAVAGRAAQLSRQLRATPARAVYVNTSALAPAVPIAAALGHPTTLHIHETWGPFERRVLTQMCRPADVLVTVGEATRLSLPEVLRRRAVVRRHRVSAQPVPDADVAAVRSAAGIGDEQTVLLFAGRWTPGKGLAEFLQAFADASRDDLHLLLLGGPPPSGAAVDAPRVIENLGLTDRVTVVGEVPDVWPYLYASDAVAVPSVKPESYPTIALEALAAGRPVLASRIGGLPEIVTPGRGQLIIPGDVAGWTTALKQVQGRGSATIAP